MQDHNVALGSGFDEALLRKYTVSQSQTSRIQTKLYHRVVEAFYRRFNLFITYIAGFSLILCETHSQ